MATNWVQNFYHPINPDKYIGDLNEIVFRSSWERHLFQFCDNTSSVLKWSSEPFAIKYWDESSMKTRRYFPDVYMEIVNKDGQTKKYLAEVKPYRQTQPPKEGRKKTRTYINECKTYQKNTSKWKFAEEFCDRNGMEFIILTESDLGIK